MWPSNQDGLVVVDARPGAGLPGPPAGRAPRFWGVGPVTPSPPGRHGGAHHWATWRLRDGDDPGAPARARLPGRQADRPCQGSTVDPRPVGGGRAAGSIGAQSALGSEGGGAGVRTGHARVPGGPGSRPPAGRRAAWPGEPSPPGRVRFPDLRSVTRSTTLPVAVSATLTVTEDGGRGWPRPPWWVPARAPHQPARGVGGVQPGHRALPATGAAARAGGGPAAPGDAGRRGPMAGGPVRRCHPGPVRTRRHRSYAAVALSPEEQVPGKPSRGWPSGE